MTEEKEIKECEGITGRCACVCLSSQKQKKKQQCGGEVNKTPWNSQSAHYSCQRRELKDTSVSTQKRGNTQCVTVFIKFGSYLLFTPRVCLRTTPSSSTAPEKNRGRRRISASSVNQQLVESQSGQRSACVWLTAGPQRTVNCFCSSCSTWINQLIDRCWSEAAAGPR